MIKAVAKASANGEIIFSDVALHGQTDNLCRECAAIMFRVLCELDENNAIQSSVEELAHDIADYAIKMTGKGL
jgi:hypothetical protein